MTTCAICRGEYHNRTHCPFCGAAHVNMGHGKNFCDNNRLVNHLKFIGLERAPGAVSMGQYPYRAPNYRLCDSE